MSSVVLYQVQLS